MGHLGYLNGHHTGYCNCHSEDRLGGDLGGEMKRLPWVVSALVFAWMAYSVGPDLRRYLKMRAM